MRTRNTITQENDSSPSSATSVSSPSPSETPPKLTSLKRYLLNNLASGGEGGRTRKETRSKEEDHGKWDFDRPGGDADQNVQLNFEDEWGDVIRSPLCITPTPTLDHVLLTSNPPSHTQDD